MQVYCTRTHGIHSLGGYGAKMQGFRQGGGAEAPLDFKLMLLCVQAVTAKGHPKRTTRQMIIIVGGEPELCGMCSAAWLSEHYVCASLVQKQEQ